MSMSGRTPPPALLLKSKKPSSFKRRRYAVEDDGSTTMVTSGSEVEVENQSLPSRAALTFATRPIEPSEDDFDMNDKNDPLDQDYPSRYYSDEVDSDPEDHDYEMESVPTSPMSLTESERGKPDFSDVQKDLDKYDTDPKVPPPPEKIQGALALYTEKEIEVLRKAYEMIEGRPARWFREKTAEPEEPAEKEDVVVVEDGDADETAVVIDPSDVGEDDWVNV